MTEQGNGSGVDRAVGDDEGRRLRATLDSLLDPHMVLVCVRDDAGAIVDLRFGDANDAACEYVQRSRADLLGRRMSDVFPGAVRQGAVELCARVIETGEPVSRDDTPFMSEVLQEERFYDVRIVRLGDGIVMTLRDVTDRHVAAARLAESESMYRLLAENAWDVIWTMELDGSISYISPSVERVRGITPAEAMAQTLDQIHPAESAARVTEYFGRLFEAIVNGTELPTFHGEQEYYRKDGSIMHGELDVAAQVDAEGRPLRIVGVTRDISERKRYEAELSRFAVTDPLTGAWNRRYGEQVFAADLAEARRYGPALSLLLLDIDHFKEINDTHGHQVGDRVLVELTRRLTESLRASDVLVRWGGEEFVVAMRHCTIADALPLAEKLRCLVADTPFDEVGRITVSIGAAEFEPGDDLAAWLHRADRAMYDAKAAGRNAVRTRQLV
jgi:diguanylate cyclase (GGDEF)-like protein/PAS domain S-box-containing protein